MFKYELFKINDDTYQIHSDKPGFKAMEGTVVGIGKYMIQELGFNPDEVEYALMEMHDKDDDGAHFGFNRTFIFSYERNPVRNISA